MNTSFSKEFLAEMTEMLQQQKVRLERQLNDLTNKETAQLSQATARARTKVQKKLQLTTQIFNFLTRTSLKCAILLNLKAVLQKELTVFVNIATHQLTNNASAHAQHQAHVLHVKKL
jgi:hypothetical protein